MLTAYAAPVLAPALPALATAFALLLLGIVFWGMRVGYMHTFGAFLSELAKLLGRAPFGIGGKLRAGVNGVNDSVQASLATAQAWANKGAAMAWHSFTLAVEYTADTILDMNTATLQALLHIKEAFVPGAVAAGSKPLTRSLGGIRAQLRTLERELERRITRRAQAIEAELDRDFGLARAGIDAVRGSLSARIAHSVRVLEGEVADIRGYTRRTLARRLTRLERRLGAGVLTGAVVVALTRVFPYWQCSNVRRFNRALCRSPVGDWTALLAFLAFGLAALDPEYVAQLAEDATDELGGIIEAMAG